MRLEIPVTSEVKDNRKGKRDFCVCARVCVVGEGGGGESVALG